MGTKLAPALATLFFSHLEDYFLALSPRKPELWLRYIDDILCVWNHGPAAFDSFLSAFNYLKPGIKFTANVSSSSTASVIRYSSRQPFFTQIWSTGSQVLMSLHLLQFALQWSHMALSAGSYLPLF